MNVYSEKKVLPPFLHGQQTPGLYIQLNLRMLVLHGKDGTKRIDCS